PRVSILTPPGLIWGNTSPTGQLRALTGAPSANTSPATPPWVSAGPIGVPLWPSKGVKAPTSSPWREMSLCGILLGTSHAVSLTGNTSSIFLFSVLVREVCGKTLTSLNETCLVRPDLIDLTIQVPSPNNSTNLKGPCHRGRIL
ncbi:unnamed protein product, partial [Meganyctiphanes norvegica]